MTRERHGSAHQAKQSTQRRITNTVYGPNNIVVGNLAPKHCGGDFYNLIEHLERDDSKRTTEGNERTNSVVDMALFSTETVPLNWSSLITLLVNAVSKIPWMAASGAFAWDSAPVTWTQLRKVK